MGGIKKLIFLNGAYRQSSGRDLTAVRRPGKNYPLVLGGKKYFGNWIYFFCREGWNRHGFLALIHFLFFIEIFLM